MIGKGGFSASTLRNYWILLWM